MTEQKNKFSDNSLTVLEKRYLAKDEQGNVIESPQEMFRRVAKNIALADKKYDSKAKIEKVEEKFYQLMANLEFLPNSPTLMNAGRELQQLAACFVLPIPDSMEGIFETVKQTALIHKTGGGTGFSFSNLRPKGSRVKSTNGVSSGPISFMKVFDSATDAIKQGGCFIGSTLVATAEGEIPISELKEGMLVYSWKPKKGFILTPCTDSWKTKKNAEVWRLETDKGFIIYATPDHPFMTRLCGKGANKKKYVNLKDLTPGIALLSNYVNERNHRVVSIKFSHYEDVYNVEVPGTHNFVVCDETRNGVVVSNTRRGANMAILRVDHPDIMEFIDCKKDNKTLNNFNISVAITDDFIKALEEDKKYDLINPANNKIIKQLDAKKVMLEIVKNAWLNGDPGIIFIDKMEKDNPTPTIGEIEACNPCGETPLLSFEACNLGSINLVKMTTNGKIDWEKLIKTTRSAVHFMDNVIDMNCYPLKQIEKMTYKNRKIGLGVMGFADMLILLGIPYTSEAAIEIAEKIMETVDSISKNESSILAKKRGAFPSFKKSKYDLPGKPELRNATTTTIAPTGTISIISGVSSGIEPIFAISYIRTIMDNDKLLEIHPEFEKIARKRGFYSEDLMKEIAKTGTVANLVDVPKDVKNLFITAHEVSPEHHIRIQAIFQKYTDNAVSKTINFSNKATIEDVEKAYLMAYKYGCKGITIYRDGSRKGQVLSTESTNNITSESEVKPRTRPLVTKGKTIKVGTGCGNMYTVINEDELNQPFELFIQIGKAGGCAASQTESTGRLVSLALRSGVSIEEITKQLKGISCHLPIGYGENKVYSCADAIARALNIYSNMDKQEYSKANNINQGACPDCGGQLEYSEGCLKCRSCGFSKCN